MKEELIIKYLLSRKSHDWGAAEAVRREAIGLGIPEADLCRCALSAGATARLDEEISRMRALGVVR
jgi:hypothetical protein